jgi:hypothetical protein
VKEGGVLLIVNQGEKENGAQKELCKKVGVQPRVSFRIRSPLFQYKHTHYVIAAVK